MKKSHYIRNVRNKGTTVISEDAVIDMASFELFFANELKIYILFFGLNVQTKCKIGYCTNQV